MSQSRLAVVAATAPSRTRRGNARLRAFRRNIGAMTGGAIVLALVSCAVLAPVIAPHDPQQMGAGPLLHPPSWAYPCGTDEFGRDILSRLIYGSRLTLEVGFFVVGMASAIGIGIGLVAAYVGGWTERILMRFVDVVFSFTETLIALAAVAVLGPSLHNAMIAVGIASMPFYARSCYSSALVELGKPYIEAVRAAGAGHLRMIFCHLLPNVLPTMIVIATLGVSSAVLAAAGLSFLGLGAQPPSPEWGVALAAGRAFFGRAPWLMIEPGAAIAISVLGFNLLGDGIRDLLDPHGAA